MHCYSNLGPLLQQQPWQHCSVHGQFFWGCQHRSLQLSVGSLCQLLVMIELYSVPICIVWWSLQFHVGECPFMRQLHNCVGLYSSSLCVVWRSVQYHGVECPFMRQLHVMYWAKPNPTVRSVVFFAIPRRRVPVDSPTARHVPG